MHNNQIAHFSHARQLSLFLKLSPKQHSQKIEGDDIIILQLTLADMGIGRIVTNSVF